MAMALFGMGVVLALAIGPIVGGVAHRPVRLALDLLHQPSRKHHRDDHGDRLYP